jgi:hypothetical protein
VYHTSDCLRRVTVSDSVFPTPTLFYWFNFSPSSPRRLFDLQESVMCWCPRCISRRQVFCELTLTLTLIWQRFVMMRMTLIPHLCLNICRSAITHQIVQDGVQSPTVCIQPRHCSIDSTFLCHHHEDYLISRSRSCVDVHDALVLVKFLVNVWVTFVPSHGGNHYSWHIMFNLVSK